MLALYHRFWDAGQNTINSYFPEVPEGSVQYICNSFALNFVMTMLESAGNFRYSIKRGGIGVLVATIQTVALMAIKHLNASLLNSAYTTWGSYILALFTTRALGISIDIKESLVTSLMIYSMVSQLD